MAAPASGVPQFVMPGAVVTILETPRISNAGDGSGFDGP